MVKRRQPYIPRVPCSRCGRPSAYQWQVCADKRQFMRIPERGKLMKGYRT